MKSFIGFINEVADEFWITDGSYNDDMPRKGMLSLLGAINVHGSDTGKAMKTLSTAKRQLKKWNQISKGKTKYYIITLQNGGEGHVVDSDKTFAHRK